MEELIKKDNFRQVDLILFSDKKNKIIEMRGLGGTLLHGNQVPFLYLFVFIFQHVIIL